MTEQSKPFAINIGDLKTRPKDSSPQAVERSDRAGAQHGFVSRPAGNAKRGGRAPTGRTKQLHLWVEPPIAEEIAEAAGRTGKTQGELVSEAWAAFRRR
jgi:hypothetical protein